MITTIAEIRSVLDQRRAAGQSVGFTPTMGYLHDGHGSLMRAADEANDVVVASIFVNPLQFSADEDLDSYPRDLEQDRRLAAQNGVDHLFVPSVGEMYENGPVLTSVSVAELSERWDGASRPTHLTGVATVVSKLFNIVGPCRAYFGEKDFQQLAVIRRMVRDLSMPVEVVGCPIIRESDGLAMSSRNSYLSPADRAAAPVLRRTLDVGRELIEQGETDPATVVAAMTEFIATEPRARLDYVAVVDPLTLETPDRLPTPLELAASGGHGAGGAAAPIPSARLLIAAYVGKPRLIDNCPATVGGDPRGRASMTKAEIDNG
ncbi:MAG: pantoate--beta-alanine ligase [Acidimicrobiales bacterium]